MKTLMTSKPREIKLKQGSSHWFAIRNERPMTASHSTTIKAQGIGLEKLVKPKKFKQEKVFFSNIHTQRGNRLEPIIRWHYKKFTGFDVRETGFWIYDEISEYAGVSPDGLVNEDGLVEIKAPNKDKFLKLLKDFKIERTYYDQMQMQLMFTGRKWVDYVVFNDEVDDNEPNMIIKRVFPDRLVQDKIKMGIKLGEVIIKKNEGI